MTQKLHALPPFALLKDAQVDLEDLLRERRILNRAIRGARERVTAIQRGDPDPGPARWTPAMIASDGRRQVAEMAPSLPEPAVAHSRAAASVHEFAGSFGVPLAPGMASDVSSPPSPVGASAGVIAAPMAQAQLGFFDVGALNRMSPDKLNALPYGVITVDARGRILNYNDTESRMVGLPKERVLGRNFFSEVAPCTRVKEFEGRFVQFAGGRTRRKVESFEFVFHFSQGAQRVLMLFSPARLRGQFQMCLVRR